MAAGDHNGNQSAGHCQDNTGDKVIAGDLDNVKIEPEQIGDDRRKCNERQVNDDDYPPRKDAEVVNPFNNGVLEHLQVRLQARGIFH